MGIALDNSGNLYIADTFNQRIRKVDTSGAISTVAGNGTSGFSGDGGAATDANLSGPVGIYVDGSGDLYIADNANGRIRKVDPSGIISTVAGSGAFSPTGDGGPATDAALVNPADVFLDGSGNLYIAERAAIRKVDPSGTISTVAGSGGISPELGDGGPATDASLNGPGGVFVDASGDIYIADTNNHRIRKVSPPPLAIRLSANPEATAVGDVSTIRAEILDRNGNLKTEDDSTRVSFRIAAGEGSLFAEEVTVSGGIATTRLTGSAAGTVAVQASAQDAESVSVFVLVFEISLELELTATPNSIMSNGIEASTVQVRILDLDGNPKSDDNTTVVSFSASGSVIAGGGGVLSNEEVVISEGVATTTLTSSTPGVAVVQAGAAGAKNARVLVTIEAPAEPEEIHVPPAIGQEARTDLDVNVILIAGGSIKDHGPATEARLNQPTGLFLDDAGNQYIADRFNHRIRKVDAATGLITTVAGNGIKGFAGDGGPATNASLAEPSSVFLDGAGTLYISDTGNQRIRKMDLSGIITTVAGDGFQRFFPDIGVTSDGGPATGASLNTPLGISVDGAGNLYIADSGSHRIRQVDTSGTITTVAGSGSPIIVRTETGGTVGGPGFSGDGGQATEALLNLPYNVFLDGEGNLYIADKNNSRIRKVDTSGQISTVAEGLDDPTSVTVDGSGNLYILEFFNSRIRKVDTSGAISTVALDVSLAKTPYVSGMVVDGSENLYITDTGNRRILKAHLSSGAVTVVAGGEADDGGQATLLSLCDPQGLFQDTFGNLYIADTGNHRILKVDPSGIATTIAGNGIRGFSGDGGPATDAKLSEPTGVFLDDLADLYIADGGNHKVRKMDSSGDISTVAGTIFTEFSGDGIPATEANMGFRDIFIDPEGNLFIADTFNDRIRKVDLSGIITTIAGNGERTSTGDGGPATEASLNRPSDISMDGSGNLYITELFRIRKVDPQGTISSVAGVGGGITGGITYRNKGDGGPAQVASLLPQDISVDRLGNLYIADGERIRKVDPSGIITTTAGPGGFLAGRNEFLGSDFAFVEVSGVTVNLPSLQAMHIDRSGNFYVSSNNRILKILNPSLKIELTADRSPIDPDGIDASTLKARILGPDGGLRSDDNTTIVRFYITEGEGDLSVEEVTAAGGIATTTLTGTKSGIVIVEAGAARAESAEQAVVLRGEYYLFPPVLHLASGATSSVPLEVRDRDGNKVTGDIEFFGMNLVLVIGWTEVDPPLISVSPDGFVTALRQEVIGVDIGTEISARINGQEVTNRSSVRVLSREYDVSYQEIVGENMVLYYPSTLEGEDISQFIVSRYQVPTVNEYAYTIQSGLTGTQPVNGFRLILSSVFGDAEGVELGATGALSFGGRSSTSIKIGYHLSGAGAFMNSSENSFPRSPEWFVYYHELGHNFTGSPFLSGMGFGLFSYGEMVADVISIETMEKILSNPGEYAITEDTRASMQRSLDEVSGSLSAAFQTWLDNGTDFNEVDDIGSEDAKLIVGGIYLHHKQLRGSDFGERYFRPFDPQHYSRFTTLSERVIVGSGFSGNHTAFAALVSAAAGQDLSATFKETYHFPINQPLFDQTYQALLGVMDPSIQQSAETPTGANVPVQFEDAATGASPASLTFSNVTQAGATTLSTGSTGAPPPEGFQLGDPPVYYDIATTALFDGPVEVCFNYGSLNVGSESSLKLFHFENFTWVDATTSLDTDNNIICGSVTSFSTFTVLESETPSAPSPDFTGDGIVNFDDFVAFAKRFGAAEGAPNYDAKFDLDGDKKIGFGDFVIFAQNFGKTVKPALTRPADLLKPGINLETGLALSPRAGKASDQVALTIRLADAVQVQGYSLRMRYDVSSLELLEAATAQGASIFSDHLSQAPGEEEVHPTPVALQVSPQPGEIFLTDMLRSEAALEGEGNLVRLTFRLLDPTVPGSVEIADAFVSDPSGRINPLLGARLTELRALPDAYALSQNYPNPFNPDTQIPYQLPEAGEVSLVIYNTLGQQVRVLTDEKQEAGYYRITWDGKDAGGRWVSSGVYLMRMVAGKFSEVKKMVLLK